MQLLLELVTSQVFCRKAQKGSCRVRRGCHDGYSCLRCWLLCFCQVSRCGRAAFPVFCCPGLEDAGADGNFRVDLTLNWFEELKQRVPTGR